MEGRWIGEVEGEGREGQWEDRWVVQAQERDGTSLRQVSCFLSPSQAGQPYTVLLCSDLHPRFAGTDPNPPHCDDWGVTRGKGTSVSLLRVAPQPPPTGVERAQASRPAGLNPG